MRRRREAVCDIYNLVIAAVLIVSPWLFALTRETARADAWLSGIIIASLSCAALLLFAEWEEWIVLVCGAWVVASPWLLGFPHTVAMRLDVGIGIVVMYLAGLELWLIHYDGPTARPSR
jgi:SPW repeat